MKIAFPSQNLENFYSEPAKRTSLNLQVEIIVVYNHPN
jgi:hypothetical protein